MPDKHDQLSEKYVLELVSRLVEPGMNDGIHEVKSVALGPSVVVITLWGREPIVLKVHRG